MSRGGERECAKEGGQLRVRAETSHLNGLASAGALLAAKPGLDAVLLGTHAAQIRQKGEDQERLASGHDPSA
jgi:hypothetical protein